MSSLGPRRALRLNLDEEWLMNGRGWPQEEHILTLFDEASKWLHMNTRPDAIIRVICVFNGGQKVCGADVRLVGP
jgi:hypothetical protein